jgi:hypothetical protein
LITKTIKSELSSELTPLQNQIDYLKIKLDDQDQYSRRTNLKISGIKEQGPSCLRITFTADSTLLEFFEMLSNMSLRSLNSL